MSYPSDSYAHLVVAGMGGEAEHVKVGTGVLTAWDPGTFANTVRHRGADFHNLPVLQPVEALSFAPGQVVLLEKRRQAKNGLYTYAIKSSPVAPGSGAADAAVAFMRGTLARQIAAEVFAERITSITESASIGTTSETFTALTGGPTVSGVEITDAGRALVFATSWINAFASTSMSVQDGVMSFEVSGATSVSATDVHAVANGIDTTAGSEGTYNMARGRASSLTLLEDLNPGVHSFAARYRVADSASSVLFFNRNLTVIAF